MRWRDGRRSSNIEDRRGEPAQGSGGGGGRRLAIGGKGGGIGTILLILAALYFGVDPSVFLQQGGGQRAAAPPPVKQDRELADFVSVVLADTEDTWRQLFRKTGGKAYQEPTLVLFTDSVQSACGFAESAMGPFYCPGDSKVYIDLGFYDELKRRFGAPGDFAQAYVIAHEIGHHVQHLLGISDQVQKLRAQSDEKTANAISVRLELQADCLAGVWANHADKARHILEKGDLEEALKAAAAIGDDRLQKQSRGYVTPDSFTHGSSAQRVRWFRKGMAEGTVEQCNTFAKGIAL